MQANSRQVSSNQPHLHPGLRRGATAPGNALCATVADHNRVAFDAARRNTGNTARWFWILSAALGTAPRAGPAVSRSPGRGHRQIRPTAGPAPAQQRETTCYCRPIARTSGMLLAQLAHREQHYLLYPNPWPKAKHLQRRVHGHGSFPLLLQLGASHDAAFQLATLCRGVRPGHAPGGRRGTYPR